MVLHVLLQLFLNGNENVRHALYNNESYTFNMDVLKHRKDRKYIHKL